MAPAHSCLGDGGARATDHFLLSPRWYATNPGGSDKCRGNRLQCTTFPSPIDLILNSDMPPLCKRKKKSKTRCPCSATPPIPPVGSPSLLMLPVRFGDRSTVLCALLGTGAQADVISPHLVHRLDLHVRRLDAPVHAALASGNKGVCLALFVVSDLQVNGRVFPNRSFFVPPLPDVINAILGMPFMKESGYAVSAISLLVAPEGPPSRCTTARRGRPALNPMTACAPSTMSIAR